MDILQEYALSAVHFYHTCDPYLRPLRDSFSTLQSRTIPIIMPYLDILANYVANSPGLLVVALALVLLLLARVVLAWIWRTILFWMRVGFYAILVLGLAVAWQRGFDQTGRDLGRWAGELGRFWWKEYQRFEGYQKAHQQNSGDGYRQSASWR